MSFLPSKFTMGIIAVLVLACGYFYITKQWKNAELQSAQILLNEANTRVATQQTTIDLLQKDAAVQKKLMDEFAKNVDEIREQTILELLEIEKTNFGEEANRDAKALEEAINARSKKLLDNISRISREGTK